jgi:hypothetical protein
VNLHRAIDRIIDSLTEIRDRIEDENERMKEQELAPRKICIRRTSTTLDAKPDPLEGL